MVVAVVAVGVVQLAGDEVVDVVAVRDGRVPAVGAMDVIGVVALASVCAAVRMLIVDGDDVLIDVVAVGVVQMAVVHVIDVTFVSDREVTAVRTVLMGMI